MDKFVHTEEELEAVRYAVESAERYMNAMDDLQVVLFGGFLGKAQPGKQAWRNFIYKLVREAADLYSPRDPSAEVVFRSVLDGLKEHYGGHVLGDGGCTEADGPFFPEEATDGSGTELGHDGDGR